MYSQQQTESPRQIKVTEAVNHINSFLKNNTNGQEPLQLLYDLLMHDSSDVGEGAALIETLTEDLIRFFMQPDIAAAFKSSAITSTKKMASVLVQMQWFFRELNSPVALAHMERFTAEQYAGVEEMEPLTRKYNKLAEIQEATISIQAKYNQAA